LQSEVSGLAIVWENESEPIVPHLIGITRQRLYTTTSHGGTGQAYCQNAV